MPLPSLIISAAFLIMIAAVTSRPLIPGLPLAAGRLNGYPISTSASSPSAKLDVYLGPFCEDSRRFWPMLRKLDATYAPKGLEIRVHIFPLAYNLQSVLAAQSCVAAGVVVAASSGAKNATSMAAVDRETVIKCLDLLYDGDNQRTVKQAAMSGHTTEQVIHQLVALVGGQVAGVDPAKLEKQLVQGLESGASSYDMTKSDLKFGQAHGVFATPSVHLNGMAIVGVDDAAQGQGHMEGALASLTEQQWSTLIDEILAQ